MSQQELLIRVTDALEQQEISYLLTGSFASSHQGEPRASHDIDLVVALSEANLDLLCSQFPPPKYYVSAAAARDAVRRKSMFNLLDLEEGDKVDFWLLTDSEFDRSRFDRRIQQELWGSNIWLSTPEDTILAKLNWAKRSGGSAKQLGDVRGIFAVQKERLDLTYINEWAARLDVVDLWNQIRHSAD